MAGGGGGSVDSREMASFFSRQVIDYSAHTSHDLRSVIALTPSHPYNRTLSPIYQTSFYNIFLTFGELDHSLLITASFIILLITLFTSHHFSLPYHPMKLDLSKLGAGG